MSKLPKGWKKYPPHAFDSNSDGFYQSLYYWGETKIGINVVQYSFKNDSDTKIMHQVEMQLPSEITKSGCTMDVSILGWGSSPRLNEAWRKMMLIANDLCDEGKRG